MGMLEVTKDDYFLIKTDSPAIKNSDSNISNFKKRPESIDYFFSK